MNQGAQVLREPREAGSGRDSPGPEDLLQVKTENQRAWGLGLGLGLGLESHSLAQEEDMEPHPFPFPLSFTSRSRWDASQHSPFTVINQCGFHPSFHPSFHASTAIKASDDRARLHPGGGSAVGWMSRRPVGAAVRM